MNWKKIFIIVILIISTLIGGCMIFYKVNNRALNKEYSVSKFTKINVDIPTGHVFLKVGNKYRVSYSGAEKVMPEIKVENNELRISLQKRVLHISLFNLSQLNSKIVIEMPKEQLEDLDMDLANGNFSADYLATKTGEIDLSNGNIDIKELKTKDGIRFDTSKGNISIENSNASGYELSTSLGNVSVDSKKQGKTFETNSDTQNVLEADTSLGNISIE